MNYKRVIAFIPETSVLFELDNGNVALVTVDDEDARFLITVSKYAESHLKFGEFEDGANIPKDMLDKAAKILKKGEKVFMSRDVQQRER